MQSLNAEYHYVFYFIHTYFKLNGGLTDANKIFVADRLQKIATWLYDTSMGTHLDYDQKLNIGIWSVKYLLENPNVTWEDYKNQFLDYSNIKIDSSLTNTKTRCVLQKMSGDINLGDNKITLTADATNDNLFRKMLRKFDGNNMPSLNFEIKSSLQVNEWGITKGTNSNSYNIIINQDIENQSNLLKTVILSHELIHAFMFNHLYSLNIINFDNDGNPILTISCSPSVNYNNINLNLLDEKERFVALFCAMNQNGNLTPQWSHDIFNSSIFGVEPYRSQLENYLLNFHDWNAESQSFKNEAESIFGINWKSEVAKAVSWSALENTIEYSNYINSYSNQIQKKLYIHDIKNKIKPLKNTCQ